jgi:hypothetical protein
MRNRSEYRQKMSERGQRAAEIRWANYHAGIPSEPEIDPTKDSRIQNNGKAAFS